MKLSNLFKKETASKSKNTNVQTIDKKQLAKVIGGTDTTIVSSERRGIEKDQIK